MIDAKLKEIYDEFDRHARIHNIDYSIDADYHNVQGYRLLDCNDVSGFLRHIANFVKDKPVNLDYDGVSINYDRLKKRDFSVNTYNPLFMFTLKPIQEDSKLDEEQYKHPTTKHTRSQAPFPSSSREHETAFTYKQGKTKKMKKKTLADSKSFDDKLVDAINENIVSAVDPEILFTRDSVNLEDPENVEEALQDALQAESVALNRYLAVLEATENESHAIMLENMIENCTKHIDHLRTLIEEK